MSKVTHHYGCDLNVVHPDNVTGTFIIQANGIQTEYKRFVDIPRWIEEIIAFKPDFIPPPHTHEQHEYNANVRKLFHELRKRIKPVDQRIRYASSD